MSSARQQLATAAKALVSVALIAYLVTQTDIGAVADRLAGIDLSWLLAALTLMAVQVGIAAFRWTVVLKTIGGPLQFATAARIVFIGLFFNQTLPSAIGGDVVRIWRACKAGLPVKTAANSVLLDRLTALAATVLIVAAATPLLFDLIDDAALRTAVAGIVVAGLAGFGVLLLLDRIIRLPERWRLTRVMHAVAFDARRVFLSRGAATRTIGLSAIILVGSGVTVYLLARSLDIQVDVLTSVILTPLVLLMMMIPVSLAGWGVREMAMVTAFGYAQVAPADALALSITFGLAFMATGLPGGILWLRRHDRPGADIRETTPGPPGT